MAYLTNLYSNSLSNQSLVTALLLGTYTNTTRLRKIYVDVWADQIVGSGNYTVYATRQRSGAGSAYEVGARTTVAVPSGVTAQAFPSIALMCGTTDVIKTYLVGLAGDTTTPDTIMEVSEEFVLTDASGLVTFANTSIATVTTLTNAPPNSAGTAAMLVDYARRTGDYATVSALATLQGNVTTILTDYARRTGDYATVAALAALQTNVTTLLGLTDTEIQSILTLVNAIALDYARRTGDYATQASVNTIDDFLDTEITALLTAVAAIPTTPAVAGDAMTLTTGERDSIAASLLDLANAIETGLTPREALRLIVAANAGKLSGALAAALNTILIRNAKADSKVRITASTDEFGNRTAITTDLT